MSDHGGAGSVTLVRDIVTDTMIGKNCNFRNILANKKHSYKSMNKRSLCAGNGRHITICDYKKLQG